MVTYDRGHALHILLYICKIRPALHRQTAADRFCGARAFGGCTVRCAKTGILDSFSLMAEVTAVSTVFPLRTDPDSYSVPILSSNKRYSPLRMPDCCLHLLFWT